ncbi:hypothetical protein ACWC4C_44915 [Streptomyces olivaceoviridis]
MRILLWKDAGLAGTSVVMPGWALIGAVKATVDGTTPTAPPSMPCRLAARACSPCAANTP